MNAAPFAPRLAADEGLIQLDRPLCANAIPVWAHHCGTQLVQHLERRLVTGQSKLALELQRGPAWRLRRHQIRRPEPDLQWCAGRVHDGPRREIRVALAVAAPQDRRLALKPVRRALRAAAEASKAIRPTDLLQIGDTGLLIGKHPLKVQQACRQTLRHARTLPAGVLGVNRIGMRSTTPVRV